MKKNLTLALAGVVILLIAACSPLAQAGDPTADSNITYSTVIDSTIWRKSARFASSII